MRGQGLEMCANGKNGKNNGNKNRLTMKKANVFFKAVVIGAILISCGNNQKAKTHEQLAEIQIGDQIWMNENLNVVTFRNGDSIPEAKTAEEWINAGKEGQPAWCYYENNPTNEKKYGKLYNWYAISDPRGLPPKEWHIPTDEEWVQLADYLGGEEVAGTKMKSISGWYENKKATNESGFNGLPGGARGDNGEFADLEKSGHWWSFSESDRADIMHSYLDYSFPWLIRLNVTKESGLSVRVLKNKI